MTLVVVIMVCMNSKPCDQQHARIYQSFHAEPGQIVCGLPSGATIIQSDLRPDENEYISIKCRLN